MKKTLKKALSAFSAFCVMLMTLSVLNIGSVGCKVSAYEYENRGIDVSSWNGKVNWNKVANSNIDFAFIRAGTTNYNSDILRRDSSFENNYSGVRNTDIKVGTYYFCGAYTEAGFEKDAYDILSILDGKEFDLPVYIDLEYDTELERKNIPSKQKQLGKQKLTSYVLKALDIIRDSGYETGVYANRDWFKNYLDVSRIRNAGHDIWLAQYPYANFAADPTDFDRSTECDIWQYSNKGRVNGISGDVDVNVSYVNYNSNSFTLPAPNVNVSVDGQIVTISWNKVENATHYDVRIWLEDGTPYENHWGGDPDETSLTYRLPAYSEYIIQVCSSSSVYNTFTYCNPIHISTGYSPYNTNTKSFEDYSSVSVPEGIYYFSPKCAPNSCIDSEGGETLYNGYNHNIHLWTYLGNSNQHFSVEYAGTKGDKILYYIKNTLTNEYLVMHDENNVSETPFQVNLSRWYFLDCGNGYYKIINYFSNLALDIYGAYSDNGTNAWCYDPSDMGNSAQLFKLNKVEVSSNQNHSVYYRVNSSNGVNVRTGAGSSYSRVGAASNGITFEVSQISGNWGYTPAIQCTNGWQSGWVCLDYCVAA